VKYPLKKLPKKALSLSNFDIAALWIMQYNYHQLK